MLWRALRLRLGPCLSGRGLGTYRRGSTLGKVEGSGGYRGSGVSPVSSLVTFRTQNPSPRWEDSGSLGVGGNLACRLPELVEPGQGYGSQSCLSQVTYPR